MSPRIALRHNYIWFSFFLLYFWKFNSCHSFGWLVLNGPTCSCRCTFLVMKTNFVNYRFEGEVEVDMERNREERTDRQRQTEAISFFFQKKLRKYLIGFLLKSRFLFLPILLRVSGRKTYTWRTWQKKGVKYHKWGEGRAKFVKVGAKIFIAHIFRSLRSQLILPPTYRNPETVPDFTCHFWDLLCPFICCNNNAHLIQLDLSNWNQILYFHFSLRVKNIYRQTGVYILASQKDSTPPL